MNKNEMKLVIFYFTLNITFLVKIPTMYGQMMPGKVPNVFVMPNTMPEKEPAISFIFIKGPAPQ